MDEIFINHLKDLSLRSEQNSRYTFTQFLSLDEQSTLKELHRNLYTYTLFGGIDGAERVVARFGNAEEFGYEESFPIICLKAEPVLKKFADQLCHRDFLGALMNLGIERKYIGDIILKESSAYIFIIDKMADYIMENLTKVRHTVIKVSPCDELPEDCTFSLESVSLPVTSLRLDCIIAACYSLSRSQCNELFAAKKVFVNGKLTENISHTAREGDIISLRGFGRFIFTSVGGTSKKGRTYVNLDKFI